jgi:hypothetical protein
MDTMGIGGNVPRSNSGSLAIERAVGLPVIRDSIYMEYAVYGLQQCRERCPLGGINKVGNHFTDCSDSSSVLDRMHQGQLGTEYQNLIVGKFIFNPRGLSTQDARRKKELEEQLHGGSCTVLAFLTRNFIMAKYNIEVEVAVLGGHMFLVIGRRPGSNPEDINSWGDEAIICDPWADKAYPPSQFKEMQKGEDISCYEPDPDGNPQLSTEHYLTGTPQIFFPGRDLRSINWDL